MSVIAAADEPHPATAHAEVRRLPGIAVAATASIGAGLVHAGAIGIHAEHAQLARIFVVLAVLQLGAGLVALWRPGRLIALAIVAINLAAVAGWLLTRISGISWIDGLEVSEAPQFADTACALLGAIAAGAAIGALLIGWRQAPTVKLFLPAAAIALLAIPALWSGSSHVHSEGDHSHGDATGESAPHDHGSSGVPAVAGDGGDESQPHSHGDDTAVATDSTAVDESQPHTHGDDTVTTDHAHSGTNTAAVNATWPRPWDPSQPIDITGVAGVSAVQELRAVNLIEASLRELPRFADTSAAVAAGYKSIGDAGTGSEHYIKADLIEDDVMLDATQPESLVYSVDGDKRTLAGAMYIASSRPVDDPSLTDFAGPLMQWHIHDNLCWEIDEAGAAHVVGIIDADGNCARGVRAGGGNPMVHVWVTPHPCGVFAALEGIGAGSAAVADADRVDMCQSEHQHSAAPTVAPVPYDPTKPIDLGGVPGVTPEQQAAAENLVAINIVELPQWADYHVAEAAGFRSIGDSITGHEHFVKWDWINDDVYLDPDHPESLVYEPQPDGSKKLVSAMYMLPDTVALEDVPDIGGPLMQWHIHNNLCYTSDPDHPRVAGLTNADGTCPAGLVKHDPAPMIHVWITPHPCGPFASLEGIGAGQIKAGEERLCDEAHGSH